MYVANQSFDSIESFAFELEAAFWLEMRLPLFFENRFN